MLEINQSIWQDVLQTLPHRRSSEVWSESCDIVVNQINSPYFQTPLTDLKSRNIEQKHSPAGSMTFLCLWKHTPEFSRCAFLQPFPIFASVLCFCSTRAVKLIKLFSEFVSCLCLCLCFLKLQSVELSVPTYTAGTDHFWHAQHKVSHTL